MFRKPEIVLRKNENVKKRSTVFISPIVLKAFEKIKKIKNGIKNANVVEKNETDLSPPTAVSVTKEDAIPPVSIRTKE
jgi:hypothetical protein